MDINLVLILMLAGIHWNIEYWHVSKRFSSFPWQAIASGVAIAYVFLSLLPDLGQAQNSLSQDYPWLTNAIYVVSLFGLLLFYLLRCQMRPNLLAVSLISSSALSNFLFSYLLTHMSRLVDCLLLFVAIGLRFWINDYGLHRHFPMQYQRWGRWLLAVALLSGWGVAKIVMIHNGNVMMQSTAIAAIKAFLVGSVVLSVLTYDLASARQDKVIPFTLAAVCYAAILLEQA